MKKIVIGARGSALAMWQANHVRDLLMSAHSGLDVTLKVIHTKGDAVIDRPLHKMLDKGLFTKEIENALQAGEVDLAVHSLKDLPTKTPDGLTVAAVTQREDPADMLVSKSAQDLEHLPPSAEVLTGSLRRRAQLLCVRADLRMSPIRGNVETRLRKLREGGAEATVLARAGLSRLKLLDANMVRMDPATFLPACGQGALAIETRADDETTTNVVAALEDAVTRLAVTAERAFLAAVGGGCQAPIGAYGRLSDDYGQLMLTAVVSSIDGQRLLRETLTAKAENVSAAETLGAKMAETLCDRGGREILDEVLKQVRQEQDQ